jgi:energy-coupling factor transport system ATP-binding protein
MIHIRDLTVSYGYEPVLDVPHLDIAAGECVLVTGPSGCGKSTLARVLSGLIPQAIGAIMAGEVTVGGQNVREHSIAELATHVGTVFQNPATQLFHLRVADDVAFGPRNLGLQETQIAERVSWALAATGISALAQRNPATLSGGQKQLVAIAAALAMRPQVLLLDEPTASLDNAGTARVLSALRTLQAELGLTIVLIEHRLAEVAQLADRILVLDAGRISVDGPLSEVLADRQFLRKTGLRRPLDAPPASWESLLCENGHKPDAAPLLALQGISAGYDGRRVLENLDLTLFAGEFAALVGANGCGKSTLALVAAGLLNPMAGTLRFDGTKRPQPGLDISLLFQDPAEQLFTNSVDEEVAFGPRNYGRFTAPDHEQVLAAADLADLRERRPVALSLGQQQRTALAAAVALRPRLLILDEPTLGQDWGHMQRLMDFLLTLNREGMAILLITHDYKLVHHYAGRVVLMENGRIVMDGRVRKRELSDETIHA